MANRIDRSFAWIMLFAMLFSAPAVAQNLLVNPGFENNPPTNFGNNIGYPITPWILGGGNSSNVVMVDGGSTFNYSTSGPSRDADPATGVGVRQRYLDIASGANDFYQSFTVPICGGAPGQTRTATFSGWFSTRDNLSGVGSVSIRNGAGVGGTLLATAAANLPAPVSPATSGNSPWVKVSGSVNVVSGSTISYVVSMDNNLNFDEAVLTLTSITCVTSSVTLRKSWVGAAINDTATVTLTRAGTTVDTLASTANTATEIDSDASPPLAFQGETLTLAETLGGTNIGLYNSGLACTGGGTLAGSSLTVGSSGTAIVCTYTNSRFSSNLSVTKTNTPGVNGEVDQAADVVVKGLTTNYVITVANAGPDPANGAVLKDPVAAGLNCTSVVCAVGSGAAVCPAVTVAGLQSTNGVTIATLPANSSLTFTVTCSVL